MNKNKKIYIAKQIARNILLELSNKKYYDAFVSRYYTKTKCLTYLEKCVNEYFKKYNQLVSWNKNTWLNIFDDSFLIDSLVFYMQDFNLAKEIENENN